MLGQGTKVTINSNDPSYFQNYVANDMHVLAQESKLAKEDIIQPAKNSFEIAFMSEDKNKSI